LHGLRLAGLTGACGLSVRLLGGRAGAGIYEHGTNLADPAVRRPVVLAAAAGPGTVAGPQAAFGEPRADRHGVPLGRVHRGVLRDLTHLGSEHALFDDRILALVAGAPVGRGLLRSVRDGSGCADLHASRAG